MNIDLRSAGIKTLFLDIGGVLLTNGWGHESRALAADKFGLDKDEMDERHQLAFETYELGKTTLDEYLQETIFYRERNFSAGDFKNFIFRQSQELAGHIAFFKEIKQRHRLKVVTVSNEGREINEFRIKQFRLDELFDAYVSSCYVRLRKPDKDILQMACDITHTNPKQVLYVDDNAMMAELGKSFGLTTLHFQGLDDAKDFINTCTFFNQPDKAK